MILISPLLNMINKSKILKVVFFPILSIGILGMSLSLFGTNIEQEQKSVSRVVIEEPTEKGVVKFVVGSITSSNVTPLQCKGDTKYLLFGKFFNTTDRIVGLRSQDTIITLRTNNVNYDIKAFTDECIKYTSKQDYLLPNTNTKGYFEIVNGADSASNLELDENSEVDLTFETNKVTDEKVKDRLNLETSVKNEQLSFEDSSKPAFVVQEKTSDPSNSTERTVIGSLIFLALCPISILVGLRVYRTKKKKD